MRLSSIGLVSGLVVFLAGSAAWAQNPGRVLNGHRFIPSEQIATPFVTSYIKTATGGGAAFDLKTPFIDVNGDTLGTLEGNVAFMNLAFQYQQKVTDWLALRGGFTGSARVGIDEQSMLAQGTSRSGCCPVRWISGATTSSVSIHSGSPRPSSTAAVYPTTTTWSAAPTR